MKVYLVIGFKADDNIYEYVLRVYDNKEAAGDYVDRRQLDRRRYRHSYDGYEVREMEVMEK